MSLAAIDDDAALGAEVDSVHQLGADRAFDVGYRILVGLPMQIDAVQTGSVDEKNIGDGCFQQRFQFSRIEKKSQTLIASFYEKFTVLFQVDSFQVDGATGADAGRFVFMSGVVMYAPEIDVIAAAAIVTQDGTA